MAQGYLHTLTISMVAAVANGIAQSQSPAAGAITLNGSLVVSSVAIMDVARRVVLTSGGNDSGITFTVTGTDRYGRAQSETVVGANAGSVSTRNDFLTVSAITHTGSVASTIISGTTGVASSAPLIIDAYATRDDIGVTLDFIGTANSSIEVARDDLSPANYTSFLAYDFTTNFPSWTAPSALASKAALTDATIPGSYTMIRLTQNSATPPATCIAKIVLPFASGRY